MEDLHFDDATNVPAQNMMHQHLRLKLGKQTDTGHKTPMRRGLGMIVNESKTPGAKSLQGFASARKTPMVKETAPIGFEIFQDETEDLNDSEPVIEKIEERPCSPIDTANRINYSDSLGADIEDDRLNWPDQDVVLSEEPLGDYDVPKASESELFAELGIEEWDEYPPIDIASRRQDDFDYPISIDDFKNENVVLEEGDYPDLYEDFEGLQLDPQEMRAIGESLLKAHEDIDIEELLAEQSTLSV